MTPSVSVAGSVVRKPCGRECASVASSIALMPSGFSTVVRFQVSATRSRQKLVSRNMSEAAAVSPFSSALLNVANHVSAVSAAVVAGRSSICVMAISPLVDPIVMMPDRGGKATAELSLRRQRALHPAAAHLEGTRGPGFPAAQVQHPATTRLTRYRGTAHLLGHVLAPTYRSGP